jgi:pantoate--beta-alanine ligase
MYVVNTIAELHKHRRNLSGTLGLVPTMGYLHDGHLALVAQAKQENDQVAVSIFVNPTQFNANEDLSHYPRSPKRDLDMLQEAGVTLVFMPSTEEMYPSGFQTSVEVSEISQGLEGTSRPGHFRGVATVVSKLFNLVQPDRVYFGQKDAQQVAVIRRMIVDLNFPLEMVVVPTVREAEGLAMSSRNVYLSLVERRAVPVIYRALQTGYTLYESGQRNADLIRSEVSAVLNTEPLAEIEYVSVADAETLTEQHGILTRSALISLAVQFGSTRLIDNWPLP